MGLADAPLGWMMSCLQLLGGARIARNLSRSSALMLLQLVALIGIKRDRKCAIKMKCFIERLSSIQSRHSAIAKKARSSGLMVCLCRLLFSVAAISTGWSRSLYRNTMLSAFAHISAWIFGLMKLPPSALLISSPTPRAVQHSPQP